MKKKEICIYENYLNSSPTLDTYNLKLFGSIISPSEVVMSMVMVMEQMVEEMANFPYVSIYSRMESVPFSLNIFSGNMSFPHVCFSKNTYMIDGPMDVVFVVLVIVTSCIVLENFPDYILNPGHNKWWNFNTFSF